MGIRQPCAIRVIRPASMTPGGYTGSSAPRRT